MCDRDLLTVSRSCQTWGMWMFLFLLLAAWVAISIVGLLIKGLFWLFVIGVILFVATAIFGGVKNRSGGNAGG